MRVSALQKRNAGIELLRIADEYKQFRSDLSDKDALKLAMLSKPKLAEAYIGCPVRDDAVDEVKQFLAKVVRTEDRPWPTYNKGKPISYRQVSKILNAFDIKTNKTIRIGEATAKGFETAWFQDTFGRYLPPDPSESDSDRSHQSQRINLNNLDHLFDQSQGDVVTDTDNHLSVREDSVVTDVTDRESNDGKTASEARPDRSGVTVADVLRVFPGARVVQWPTDEPKPASCQHCDKDSIPEWRRGGKIVQQIDPDGKPYWACQFCGRRTGTTKKVPKNKKTVNS